MTKKTLCLHEAQIRGKELFTLATEWRQICSHFFAWKTSKVVKCNAPSKLKVIPTLLSNNVR